MTGSQRRTILFVCYGGGHATMIAPVVKELNRKCPSLDTVVIGLTSARTTLMREGIPFLGFQDFVDPNQDKDALALGEALIGENEAPHLDIPRDESVAYLGMSFMDLIAEYGEDKARQLYAEKQRQSFIPLGTMRRIFDRIMPSFVVTTTSPRAELAARRVGRERGVPTMAITDMLSSDAYIAEMHVNHLTVISRSAEKVYSTSVKVMADHIHRVGNPAMDRMVENAGKSIDETWRDSHFSPGEACRYILVAEQYGYLHRETKRYVTFTETDIAANLDRIHDACRKNNAVMLVRPHPSLSPNIYKDWIADKSETAFFAQTHDLVKLLNISDLVVSNFSTIMLDALYFERPVLLVNYPESGNLTPFDKMGYATGVMIEDEVELADGMRRALTDKSMIAAQRVAFRNDFAELPCAHKIAGIIARELSC